MTLKHTRTQNPLTLSVRTQLHAGFDWKDCDDMLTYCQGNICGMLHDKPTQFNKCVMGVCKPAYDKCRQEQHP